MIEHNADRSRAGRAGWFARCRRHPIMLGTLAVLILSPLVWARRTQLNPGWNMFSPQQDVEMGQQVSRDAEQQMPMLNNARVDSYLNNLGRTLAENAPGEQYPYQFKCVNDGAINAFALPGGFIYINRGVIEAAENEAQLAGVMAHEISHVALRHGTNQASKAYVAQVPLAILGGVLGNNDSTGAMLAQLGADFATNSLLLKYSRTAESQADEMGTQILYDSGYDPLAMAQFFEIIMAEDQSGRPVEFFSNHPNPDNRVERINQEIDLLGGSSRGRRADSREFQEIKRYVMSLPAPPAKGGAQSLAGNTGRGDRGRRTTGLQILSARYGAQDRFADVRQLLQSRVQDDRLYLKVTNDSMGGDPIKVRKALFISYEWAGRTYDAVVQENQQLSIPTEQQRAGTAASRDTRSGGASDRVKSFENSILRIEHPDNWNAYGRGDIAATITPDNGLVDDGRGNRALAYGVIVNIYEPRADSYYRNRLQGEGYGQPSELSMENATHLLIEELRRSNPGMRIIRSPEAIRVDGQHALSTDLSNESPLGGRETDWLITVPHPDGLLFFVFVAPDSEFRSYNHTFRVMLDSVRFRR